ncbi:hypothetical protein Daus18300_004142 [Diaporthe australafricana]|uniref:Uncharacterized protein n=1 Tax=Diaporthe australafricana TaxID=127596 RepID=A0ABR3XAR0_9PEZI
MDLSQSSRDAAAEAAHGGLIQPAGSINSDTDSVVSTQALKPQSKRQKHPAEIDDSNNEQGEEGHEGGALELGKDDEDEEDEDDEDVPRLIRHGDHSDITRQIYSPWTGWDPDDQADDAQMFLDLEESYAKPSDTLFQEPRIQKILQKIASLSPQDFPSMKWITDLSDPAPNVPIFKDATNGDEYQINLHLAMRLTRISCPQDADEARESDEAADTVYKMRYCLPRPEADSAGQNITLPTWIIPLGSLMLRSFSRYSNDTQTTKPLAETTDYMVAIDAGSSAMPVWLISSQWHLRGRKEGGGWNIAPLPIFKGLMMNDKYGYDIACILPSIHKLATSAEALPDFKKSCDLVARTRAMVDPAFLQIRKDIAEKISGVHVTSSRVDQEKIPGTELGIFEEPPVEAAATEEFI